MEKSQVEGIERLREKPAGPLANSGFMEKSQVEGIESRSAQQARNVSSM